MFSNNRIKSAFHSILDGSFFFKFWFLFAALFYGWNHINIRVSNSYWDHEIAFYYSFWFDLIWFSSMPFFDFRSTNVHIYTVFCLVFHTRRLALFDFCGFVRETIKLTEKCADPIECSLNCVCGIKNGLNQTQRKLKAYLSCKIIQIFPNEYKI